MLCRRATWYDGIKIYATQGVGAFEHWLNTQGVENIKNVNEAVRVATPWYEKFSAKSMEELG